MTADSLNQTDHRGARRIPNRNRNFRDRRDRDHDQHRRPDNNRQGGERTFKKRFIKRDRDGNKRRNDNRGPKGGRDRKRNQDRDLDRQLKDYWVGQKGGKAEDVKEAAKQKLDSDMDNYWKQKKEEEKGN